MNHGSDNKGSTPVTNEADRRELLEAYGRIYARIATGAEGPSRAERRRRRFRKPDRG